MRNWRVDCVHSDRGSSWQSVTDGATAFRAESGEDAEWLCAVLNREAESVATSAALARMEPAECVAVSHGGGA